MPKNCFKYAALASALLVPTGAIAADKSTRPNFNLTAKMPVSIVAATALNHKPSVAILHIPLTLTSPTFLTREPSAAMPRRPAPKGLLGNLTGEMQYIEGPAWKVQPTRQNLRLEIAALGGGMETAPYLAHVGLDWRF